MSDSNNDEVIEEINKVTSKVHLNEINKYLQHHYCSKQAFRDIYSQLKEEYEDGKLDKDSVKQRYFELLSEYSGLELDEIKRIYDNYVLNDKIDFYKAYTREYTNDILGRSRSYMENASFTITETELIMDKSDNVPNKPKNDFNIETINIPFEKITDIELDLNQSAFKYPQINVTTDDEVYEVIGLGPRWVTMFYNCLNDTYQAFKE